MIERVARGITINTKHLKYTFYYPATETKPAHVDFVIRGGSRVTVLVTDLLPDALATYGVL